MRLYKRTASESAFSILTLDDDPIMTATIQAYFQRSGYLVDVENDPHRAIERVRNGSYDILLLDFLMTPICGDQVVSQIRQFNQDIFIILLTGHKSMAPPIKTVRELDIQGYYEKSDRFDQLELLVESCSKSIRQMRTIRSYKEGLNSIVESLPEIYELSSMERITDSILHTVSSLLPTTSVILTLDTDYLQPSTSVSQPRRFSSRAVGEGFSALTTQQTEALLAELEKSSSLVRDTQVLLPIVDSTQFRVGLLSIQFAQPPKYDHIQLLEVFARQVSSAICNARLHALVQEKNNQLDQAYMQMQNSYLEMISTMRRVVDAKDTYTRGHSDRVSYYAHQIAMALGRDYDTCERVRLAGLFHDVGKLFVPDEILLKPSSLSEKEYLVVKSHPRNGFDLLSVITQFRSILPAVLSHHERIDGRGYPDGLVGDQIPEEARIIAVADTFDAMTSNRQYRKALPLDRALEEQERCKGTQLDANLVDIFHSLIRERSFWQTMQEYLNDPAINRLFPNTLDSPQEALNEDTAL